MYYENKRTFYIKQYGPAVAIIVLSIAMIVTGLVIGFAPNNVAKAPTENNAYTYSKDAITGTVKSVNGLTITVIADSEESYIRMLLTVTYDNDADEVLAKADYQSWFDFDITNWSEGNIIKTIKNDKTITRVYEFSYNGTFAKATADTKVAPLFTTITVPGNLTNEDIEKLENLKIIDEAHAIQAEGFASADDAWSKFNTN